MNNNILIFHRSYLSDLIYKIKIIYLFYSIHFYAIMKSTRHRDLSNYYKKGMARNYFLWRKPRDIIV